MNRTLGRWERIGARMPKSVEDIGFPMTLPPRGPDSAWAFTMGGTLVWPRISPSDKPATYVTRNTGRTWECPVSGLPQSQGWFTVKRQAVSADTHQPVGFYFGTTSGEIRASRNEGDKWACIACHLPHIHTIESVELA